MAKVFTELSNAHRTFIAQQRIFFVATASAGSRVNLSPKGMDTFRVLDPRRVGYLDLTGSGNETSAHLVADGRVTMMFCAFTGAPMILRLYGCGHAVRPRDSAWTQLRPLFGPPLTGERQLIVAEIDRVQTSCGFGVPQYNYEGDRTTLVDWAEKLGPDGVAAYWAEKNTHSIDSLPTGLLADP